VHINRGLVFWGVALITAGAVALAIQSGTIDGAVARQWWRFWPVIIIVIGLAILAARTPFALVMTLVAGIVVGGLGGSLVGGIPNGLDIGCGDTTDRSAADSGDFGGASAEVDLDLDCGELNVTTASGSSWKVNAGYAGDTAPRIDAGGDSLRVTAEDVNIFGLSDARQSWSVVLPTDVELELSVDANAASSDLALDDASLSNLSVDANAGSVDIGLPGASVDELTVDANAGSVAITVDDATTLAGSVEINAGSIELCAPDGIGLAITVDDDNITFSHNLDERGLTRSGDTWRSGDGSAAITLDVSGNAASFTLNPDGGCSAS
jgi:hypothetical protein